MANRVTGVWDIASLESRALSEPERAKLESEFLEEVEASDGGALERGLMLAVVLSKQGDVMRARRLLKRCEEGLGTTFDVVCAKRTVAVAGGESPRELLEQLDALAKTESQKAIVQFLRGKFATQDRPS